MEGLTLYRILGKRKVANEPPSFWHKIVENNKLPERSAESLKKFWLAHENKTQEVFLCESIHFKIDFCLSFKDIPDREDLEHRLRGIHGDVFEQLETAELENSDEDIKPRFIQENIQFSASTALS